MTTYKKIVLSSLFLYLCTWIKSVTTPSLSTLSSSQESIVLEANNNLSIVLTNKTYNETCPYVNLANLSFATPEFRIDYLNHANPPALITFPGSGTMGVRVVTEAFTGKVTGSAYNNGFLRRVHGFSGEGFCDHRAVIWHVHPDSFVALKALNITEHEQGKMLLNGSVTCLDLDPKQEKIKRFPRQYKLIIPRNITISAMHVVRDFWPAVFSSYQLNYGVRHKKSITNPLKSAHINIIKKKDFDSYHFKNFVGEWIQKWILAMDYIEMHRALVSNSSDKQPNLIVLQHEKLRSTDWDIKRKELLGLAKFLIKEEKLEELQIEGKIRCLDTILKQPRAQSLRRPRDRNETALTIQDAFDSLPIAFICKTWGIIKEKAEKFGYKNWREISCD